MKLTLISVCILYCLNLYSNDFELEIMSASDGSETTIFQFSDDITYRHFFSIQNWKDSLGDWGTLQCAGNHTIIKDEATILKNYCKGLNKDGDIFWVMMDRKSSQFDAGVGKLKYRKGTGKFESYEGTECVYAISFLPKGNGSFQKANCNFKNR